MIPAASPHGRAGDRLLSLLRRPPGESGRQAGVVAGGIITVAAIGLLDYVTGEAPSFSILYLLPVCFVTVVTRTGLGYVIATAAAVTWAVAEELLYRRDDEVALAWNLFGRLATMCVVVWLIGALRTMVVRLADEERASREFLATAAHQLRTPIAGLIASAETLADEPDPAARARLVDNLIAATERARRLLSTLLEMTRLDQVHAPELRPVDVATICRREVDAAQIAHPGVEITYDGPASAEIVSDAHAFRESLSNLIDNAARHATRRVEVRLRDVDSTVAVEVDDDGAGVPTGEESRVFERFVSLDGAGGSGLGLPIARASAEAAGGDLTYRDGVFRIRVPRARRG